MNRRLLAWRVICGALFEQGAVDRAELARLLRSPDVSWAHVVGLADSHYVTPGVWLGLVAARLEATLPDDARRYLHALHAMNRRRNAALVAQLDEAVDALNAAGLTPLLLKGAAYLKHGTYADPGARILADLDMLVPAAATETARRALERIGYRPVTGSPARPKHHLPPLGRPGDVGVIELHVAAVSGPVQHVLPAAEAWRFRAEDASGRFSALSPTHAVLHRFIHDQIVDRDAARRQVSLRSLTDLAALDAHYGAAIDWAAIFDRANAVGFGSILKNYLYVARRIAGLKAPLPATFGAREAVHLRVCTAVIRWNLVGTGFGALDALSAFRIKKQFGEDQSFVSMNLHRLRIAADMLRGKLLRGIPARFAGS